MARVDRPGGRADGAAPRGRPPRVPADDLLPALTYHVVQGTGTLAEHFLQLFGTPLADSSWSDRRQRLPWEIFAELMQRVLRPRATRPQAERVLARLAPGGAGWHAVQSDQHRAGAGQCARRRAVGGAARPSRR